MVGEGVYGGRGGGETNRTNHMDKKPPTKTTNQKKTKTKPTKLTNRIKTKPDLTWMQIFHLLSNNQLYEQTEEWQAMQEFCWKAPYGYSW